MAEFRPFLGWVSPACSPWPTRWHQSKFQAGVRIARGVVLERQPTTAPDGVVHHYVQGGRHVRAVWMALTGRHGQRQQAPGLAVVRQDEQARVSRTAHRDGPPGRAGR